MRLPKHALPLIAPVAAAFVAALAASAAIPATAATAADDGGPASATAPAARAALLDLRRQAPITGDAQAGKALSTVCSACHGQAGIGVAPNFPDLAGQSATYLYVQLKTFKGGQRSDPVMNSMVLTLGDADMRNLAAYFASLAPAPESGAAHARAGAGLFSDGDPARGIPPCEACHGEGGRGPRADVDVMASTPRPPWSTIPRLQGQSGAYLAKALEDFRSGARGGTSNAAIMHGVARTLGDADIRSLAEYLDGR